MNPGDLYELYDGKWNYIRVYYLNLTETGTTSVLGSLESGNCVIVLDPIPWRVGEFLLFRCLTPVGPGLIKKEHLSKRL